MGFILCPKLLACRKKIFFSNKLYVRSVPAFTTSEKTMSQFMFLHKIDV